MSATLAAPDGARIAWLDEGEAGAPPVVFLHAFPLHRAMWAPQVAALASSHRCIAPDFRGFGESSLGTDAVTMDRLADDVAAVLDRVGLDRVTLVGLSMGGYVAFAMLRRHRDRIGALVLSDTRASADTDEARAKRDDLIALARREGSGAVAERQITGLLGKTTRERDPALVASTRAILDSAPAESIVAALVALRDRPDSSGLLAEIGVPTLLLCGAEDAITPAREMREMAAAIPGSRLEVIPDAGHLANLEAPATFNRDLRHFLDRDLQ